MGGDNLVLTCEGLLTVADLRVECLWVVSAVSRARVAWVVVG